MTDASTVELRNPQAATGRTRLIGVNLDEAMPPEWDAKRAVEIAGQSLWAALAIEKIANTVTSCPLRAGLDPTKPEQHNPRSPLAQLLGPEPGSPNPEFSARAFLNWSVGQILYTGRLGWEIEWIGKPGQSRIAALWPLAAPSLTPVPTDGKASRYFRGFTVRAGLPTEVRLTPEQVFYTWRPAHHDPREPMSPLQKAGLDVSILVKSDEYQYAFLNNGGVPLAIVVTEEFATDAERSAFRRSFTAKHAGAANAGRLAFSEVTADGGGAPTVKVEPLGISQRDSMQLEIADSKAKAVTAALGVPMGVLSPSGETFSNSDAAWRYFWRTTVRDVQKELEEAVNRHLAPLLGSEVAWFDLSEVEELQPPAPFDATEAVALVQASIISPDEARAAFRLAPIAGGNQLRPVAVPADPFAAMRSAPPVVQLHQRIEGRDPAPAPLVESTAEARAAEWRRLDAQAQTLERAWERAWSRFFDRQGKAVVARIEGRTVTARLKAAAEVREVRADLGAFDADHWRQRAVDLAVDLYENVVGSSAARVAGQFGVSFDLEAPWVQAFIQDRANQLAAGVTDTTYASVQQALADGAAAGESIDDIAGRVRDVFADASTNRAKTIARTEVVSASNGSAVESARQLPADVVRGKEWISTSDERTRDEHADADGQVVPVDGAFDVGGESLAYPGDPAGDPALTISCRCAVGFVAAEGPK